MLPKFTREDLPGIIIVGIIIIAAVVLTILFGDVQGVSKLMNTTFIP